jgi:hypothetical protein
MLSGHGMQQTAYNDLIPLFLTGDAGKIPGQSDLSGASLPKTAGRGL